MSNETKNGSILNSIASAVEKIISSKTSSSNAEPERLSLYALADGKRLNAREKPYNFDSAMKYQKDCVGGLVDIVTQASQIFSKLDREKITAHKSDYEKFYNEVIGNGPPKGGGFSRNPGGIGSGSNGSGFDGGGSGGGGTGNGSDSGSGDDDSKNNWFAWIKKIFLGLIDATSQWVSYITDKLRETKKSPRTARILREAADLFSSCWNWFKAKGVQIVLDYIIKIIIGGSFPGGSPA